MTRYPQIQVSSGFSEPASNNGLRHVTSKTHKIGSLSGKFAKAGKLLKAHSWTSPWEQDAEETFRLPKNCSIRLYPRSPKSWRAAREAAEFYRHTLGNTGAALQLYEKAAAHAPRRGPDRALIYREWGMLLRNSGAPDATDQAIEKFGISLEEAPNDEVTIHALASMYYWKGAYRIVADLLEPLSTYPNQRTRDMTLPVLIKAYELLGEIVKVAELKQRHSNPPYSRRWRVPSEPPL